MLLLSVARDQIILAEAIELARVPILILMLHLARLASVVRVSAPVASHDVIGPAGATCTRITIILVYFSVSSSFAIPHVLGLVHSHMMIVYHIQR